MAAINVNIHTTGTKGLFNLAQQLKEVNQEVERTRIATRSLTAGNRGIDGMFKRTQLSIGQATANLKAFNATMARGHTAGIGGLGKLVNGQRLYNRELSLTEKHMLRTSAHSTALAGVANRVKEIGSKWQNVGRNMTAGLSLPVLFAGTYALKQYLGYQKELARTQRYLGLSTAQFAKESVGLNRIIHEQADDFAANRTQTAKLIADFTAMGISGSKVGGTLENLTKQTLKLSSLGEVNIATAQDAVRTIRSVFASDDTVGGTGIDKTQLLNNLMSQLNVISAATSIQLNELAQALPKVAATAKIANLDMAQTAAILAGMHTNGIDAVEGANALNVALQRFTGVERAKKTLQEFGLSVFEAEGSLKNFRKGGLVFLDEVSKRLAQLSDEQKAEFLGGAFSPRQAAKVLDTLQEIGPALAEIETRFTEATRAGQKFTAADVEDLGGFAQALVASGEFGAKYLTAGAKGILTLMEDAKNHVGDAAGLLNDLQKRDADMLKALQESAPFKYEKLKQRLQAFAIEFGASLLPIAEKLLTFLTKLAGAISNLPSGFMTAMAGGLAFIAAMGPIISITSNFSQLFAVVTNLASKLVSVGRGFEVITDKVVHAAGGLDKFNQAAVEAGVSPVKAGNTLFGPKGSSQKILKQANSSLVKDELRDLGLVQSELNGHKASHKEILRLKREAVTKAKEALADTSISEKITRRLIAEETVANANHQASLVKRRALEAEILAIKEAQVATEAASGVVPGGKKKGLLGGLNPFKKSGGVDAEAAGGLATKLKHPVAIAALLALIVAIGVAMLFIKRHWDAFIAKAKPGIDKVKQAFTELKEPLGLFKKFLDSKSGKKVAENIGAAISKLAAGFAALIRFARPVFEFIISTVLFVVSLIGGDLSTAWGMFKIAGLSAIRAIITGIKLMVGLISTGLRNILSPFIRWIPGANGLLGRMQKGVDNWFVGLERGIDSLVMNVKDGLNFKAEPKLDGDGAEKEARKTKDKITEEFDSGGNEAADAFLSAFKSRIEQAMDDIKESMLKAFDEMKDARIKTFDDQIKSIEVLEKAEDELLATQEYNERRRELLKKRSLDFENYSRERAVAIYEGRIDDARMLDLEHQKSAGEIAKEIVDLDTARQRELLKNQRDIEKDRINSAKEAEETILKNKRDALEKQLDAIKEFAPQSVTEMENMVAAMNSALAAAGVQWQGTGRSNMQMWQDAIRAARTQVEKEAWWAGDAARQQFGFGVEGKPFEPTSDEGDEGNLKSGTDTPSPGAVAGDPNNPRRYTYNPNAAGPSRPSEETPLGQKGSYPAVPSHHSGGSIDGAGDKSATVQGGEFVIRRSAVNAYGKNMLEAINDKKYHEGGSVTESFRRMASAKIQEMMAKRQMEGAPVGQGPAYAPGAGGGTWQNIVALLTGLNYHVGSTTGGTHVKNSWHYQGKAVDLHGDMMGIWQRLAQYQSQMRELFYSPAPYGIKNGQRIQISDKVRKGHYNHVHAAIYDNGGMLYPGLNMAMNKTKRPEVVLTDSMLRAFGSRAIETASATAKAAGTSSSSVTIYVDNFIGERAWFEKMMRDHNVTVAPNSDRAVGATNRSISSYKDQTVRSRR